MASEIKTKSSFTATKGSLVVSMIPATKTFTLTGDRAFRDGQSIPTTAAGTLLTFGDLTTLGYALITNLDGTNFIEIGVQVAATFYPFLKLEAGQDCSLWLVNGVSYYALADTAAVILDIQALER